mmetsp:Transcript_64536/g.154163  ORF Transcript_64536/g.154163 Transcript_64536/m.154163 type:complete len:275 (+) Transcript_64536:351-1175(+)
MTFDSKALNLRPENSAGLAGEGVDNLGTWRTLVRTMSSSVLPPKLRVGVFQGLGAKFSSTAAMEGAASPSRLTRIFFSLRQCSKVRMRHRWGYRWPAEEGLMTRTAAMAEALNGVLEFGTGLVRGFSTCIFATMRRLFKLDSPAGEGGGDIATSAEELSASAAGRFLALATAAFDGAGLADALEAASFLGVRMLAMPMLFALGGCARSRGGVTAAAAAPPRTLTADGAAGDVGFEAGGRLPRRADGGEAGAPPRGGGGLGARSDRGVRAPSMKA